MRIHVMARSIMFVIPLLSCSSSTLRLSFYFAFRFYRPAPFFYFVVEFSIIGVSYVLFQWYRYRQLSRSSFHHSISTFCFCICIKYETCSLIHRTKTIDESTLRTIISELEPMKRLAGNPTGTISTLSQMIQSMYRPIMPWNDVSP